MRKTQVVVLGAGPAGYVCAIRAAQLGQQVTVIEKAELGGVCLNRGCVPSKALISAADLFYRSTHAQQMGLEGSFKVDWKKLFQWKDSVVKKLTSGVKMLLQGNRCEVLTATATFLDPHVLKLDFQNGKQEELQFEKAVIATGSSSVDLPFLRVNQKNILDSTGALALETKPKSLLCVGGGYIGLELGTFYAKMGVKVTVVEAQKQLLSGIDPELVKVVEKKLRTLGVAVHLQTQVKEVKKKKQSTQVLCQTQEGKNLTFDTEKVLVTIGRKPRTEGFGAEALGIKKDAKGFFVVNEKRQTSIPHIFAIGDCAGPPLLAHKGSKEGLLVAEVLSGKAEIWDVKAIAAVVFTDPEIATCGLTQEQAQACGYDVQVGKFPFSANARALALGQGEGMIKIVGDRKTNQVLGVHMVGPEVSNLIAEGALALEMGACVEDLAWTVHAHPTLPEVLMEAAEVFLGTPVHTILKKRVSQQPTMRV